MTEATRNPLSRVAAALDLVARLAAGAGMVGIIVVIALQVVFRYFLDQPLAWTEEVSRFLFILTSFLAITIAHRRAMHAGYTSVVARMPAAGRRASVLFADVVGVAFYLIVGFSSRNLIEVGLESTAAATGIPMAIVYLVFPLTALLGTVFCLEHLIDHANGDAEDLVTADDQRAAEEAARTLAGVDAADGPASGDTREGGRR